MVRALRGSIGAMVFVFFLTIAGIGFLEGQDLVSEGRMLFEARCVLCHLSTGLGHGMTPDLTRHSESEVFQDLQGYQGGTYGGANAQIMTVYLQGLTKEDFQALAAYIATL